jgi:choline dehydrogenase
MGLKKQRTCTLGAWVRGQKVDYDLWAELVSDKRWNYEGQLPYMKALETFFDRNINAEQHGYEGPLYISGSSGGVKFPMREHLAQSYKGSSVKELPGLDANAGDSISYGEVHSNRRDGKRQIASDVFILDGITVLTEIMVEKVLVKKNATNSSPDSHKTMEAYGVRLADGTEHTYDTVILAAGAYRSPQVLMLSGIGPREVLTQYGIDVILEQPHVGQHMHDHILIPTVWKVKSKPSGDAGSKQASYGDKIDFLDTILVPKDSFKMTIAKDNGGVEPSPSHDMLCQERETVSHALQYTGPPWNPRRRLTGNDAGHCADYELARVRKHTIRQNP